MTLEIDTFVLGDAKEGAGKLLEEAAEAFGAWQALDRPGHIDIAGRMLSDQLAYELADCVTACANFAARYGLDLQGALDRVREANRERGRYAQA